MEVIGKVECQKISENEFSYIWQFSRTSLHRSRSDCQSYIAGTESHYQFRLLFKIVNEVECKLIFYFIDRNPSSSLYSRAYLAVYISKRGFYSLTPNQVKDEGNVTSSKWACEFHFPLNQFLAIENYRFSFFLKRFENLTLAPKQSLLLQEKEGHSKSSSASAKEESKKEHYENNQKVLIQDLRSIYESGEMCDLEIRIGENILRAHKFMLCSRSPVFMKMMQHDCLESSSNSITITDYSDNSIKQFLMYLYTGEIEDQSTDTVMLMYSLGDKYDVPALRTACSDILQSKLSESVDEVANIVCDVLNLADFHNDMKLKDSAVNFIVKHFPVVSETQSWKNLMNSDFKLTSEVLALVATACQKLQT